MTTEPITSQSVAEQTVRQRIAALVHSALPLQPDVTIPIGYPPPDTAADFTVACFTFAKLIGKSPAEVAKIVAQGITPDDLIAQAQAAGPYVNIVVNRSAFTSLVLTEMGKTKAKYGAQPIGRGKRVMVEYFSPNTNKPLTVGHVRNICLGWSIARLLRFLGYKVIESTLYNDRGIAIAKTIVGYQKWGKGASAKSTGMKPDHFVGSFYVQFSQEAKGNEQLEREAQRVLQEWEKGNKEVTAVWQELMSWVLEGFRQTLNDLHVGEFNESYYESEFYTQGKELVQQGLKKGIFVKDKDGVIYAPLEKFGLPDKIVLRPDNTSLYVTQDLYLAAMKNKHRLDTSIYVVASEQDLYFKQLFAILEQLAITNTKSFRHLSYGMIRLASGKIKSREGLLPGTGADDLLAELIELARQEVKGRFKELSEKEIDARAVSIALGALKFYILSTSPTTTMVFDPKKSVAFAGRTGPYLQYVAARINSIFTKGGHKIPRSADPALLTHDLEFALVKQLARFPAVVAEAAQAYDPSRLAGYVYDLARTFSLFYEQVPVLKVDKKLTRSRLVLLHHVHAVLKQGLNLLGIETPERM